jgi:DNA-binding MarR family transcriptional regulator
MELYILTQSGRKAIPILKKVNKDVEANILEYLGMAEGATVEQVSDAMNLDEKTVYDKIRSLSANRWVWRKTTKLVLF